MKIKKVLTLTLGATLLTSTMAVQAATIEDTTNIVQVKESTMNDVSKTPEVTDKIEEVKEETSNEKEETEVENKEINKKDTTESKVPEASVKPEEVVNVEENLDMDMGENFEDVKVTQVPEYVGGDFTFYIDMTNLPKDLTVDFPEILLQTSDGQTFPGNFLVGNELVTIDGNTGAVTFKEGAFTQMNEAIKAAGLENPKMFISGNMVSQETGAFLFFELSTTVRTSGTSTETPDIPTNPDTETPDKPETPEESPISVTIDSKTEKWTGTGDITIKVNTNGATNCELKGVDGSMNGYFFVTNATYDDTTGLITIPEKALKEGLEIVKKDGGKVSEISNIEFSITFASESFESGFSTVDTQVAVSDLKDTPIDTTKPETPNTDDGNKPITGDKVDGDKVNPSNTPNKEQPKVEIKPVNDIPKTGDMSNIAGLATTGISSLGVGILAFLKRRK